MFNKLPDSRTSNTDGSVLPGACRQFTEYIFGDGGRAKDGDVEREKSGAMGDDTERWTLLSSFG